MKAKAMINAAYSCVSAQKLCVLLRVLSKYICNTDPKPITGAGYKGINPIL